MKVKKRTAVAAVVALLVCMAVYLNWSYQKGLEGDLDVAGDADLGAVQKEDPVSDEARLLGQISEVGKNEGDNATAVSDTDSAIREYFAQLRVTRQQARDEAIGVLETTSTDNSVSQEAKEVAVASISRIANNAVTEARIESLVLAKGYVDCAVFLNDDSLSIVVAPVEGGLKSEDAVRIKDIAVSETTIGVENIRIIEARVG
ncbi:MAG: SpoIIIAH-like family protein [Ruminococcaceae bacterium]|nr:SpoIIIAH-like family protein [Oscillospiraceae bacterium]